MTNDKNQQIIKHWMNLTQDLYNLVKFYLDKLSVYNKSNDFISLNYNCGLVKDSHLLKVMKNVSNVWRETISCWPNGYCFANNQKPGNDGNCKRKSIVCERPQQFPYTAAQRDEFLDLSPKSASSHEIFCNFLFY